MLRTLWSNIFFNACTAAAVVYGLQVLVFADNPEEALDAAVAAAIWVSVGTYWGWKDHERNN